MHNQTIVQLALLEDITKLNISTNKYIYSAYSFTNTMISDIFENYIKPLIYKKFIKLHYLETKNHYTNLKKPIIDNIIDDIKRSRLAIIDLTDHKNNVYFEAGIATTNYIPIIYTCHSSDYNKIAFDVNVNQVLEWNNSNINKFMNELELLIISNL
ncbi:hypothetical protein AVENP_0999 [Arcobacter venerupis]|uniref:Uncharacterized protein n=1 Tax=Arcobacter venerupis TaxID=1054033 RepID=A0AAE7B9U2_9BACT|nr:hypothetical protein [Arcobacter venerupis]QKF66555.1 hypothetical protein AVENP_0999 [Arcobacter venerupis]RWS49708.1 hypothetical protein CKA56_08285 [Arcobacter venerupis]